VPSAYDTRAKVNPPLRTEADRAALVAALAEGIIDAIATDHAPHRSIDKACALEEAAFGISGLETALGSVMQLVRSGSLRLVDVVRRLTIEPCRAFGLPYGTLPPGAPADLVIFDPDEAWEVNSADFYSKGKNTPLDRQTLFGRVKFTLVDGQPVYDTRVEAAR
jgi:dihydroorotase